MADSQPRGEFKTTLQEGDSKTSSDKSIRGDVVENKSHTSPDCFVKPIDQENDSQDEDDASIAAIPSSGREAEVSKRDSNSTKEDSNRKRDSTSRTALASISSSLSSPSSSAPRGSSHFHLGPFREVTPSSFITSNKPMFCIHCVKHQSPADWTSEQMPLLTTMLNNVQDAVRHDKYKNKTNAGVPGLNISRVQSKQGRLEIYSCFEEKLLSANELYFVGFFGNRNPFVPREVITRIWKYDEELVNGFVSFGGLGAYSSLNMRGSCNWVNLVLFFDKSGVDNWHKQQCHKGAVKLSSAYYHKICIRQGNLTNPWTDGTFTLRSTLEIDYSNGVKRVVPEGGQMKEFKMNFPPYQPPPFDYSDSLLVQTGFEARPLRLVSYLVPSVPGEFYIQTAVKLSEQLKHLVEVVPSPSGTALSGPKPDDPETGQFSKVADIAALCAPSYLRLHDLNLVTLLCSPIYQDKRVSEKVHGYWGDIVVRADKGLTSPEQLQGLVMGFNDQLSLSGYLLPLYWLRTKMGKDETFFKEWVHTGSHLNSVELVLSGDIDVACIDSHVLNLLEQTNPEQYAGLHVIDAVGPVPVPPFVASSSLPEKSIQLLADTFISMTEDTTFKKTLSTFRVDGFSKLDHKEFDIIRTIQSLNG